MPIANPNPITLAVADKYWIVKCTVLQDVILALLAPWDGQYVVGNASVQRRLAIPAGELSANVFAQVSRLSGQSNVRVVDVSAADSLAAVKAVAVYDTGETHIVNGQTVPIQGIHEIADLFAAVAADFELAAAYGAVMAAIAAEVA